MNDNLENDILTFKSIFDEIPNEYKNYFLSNPDIEYE